MNPIHLPRTFAIASLAAMVLVAAALAPCQAQTIQKWVDEKGVTHYGDAPPPEVKSGDSTKLKVAPPSEPKARPAPPAAEKSDRKSESVAATPPVEARRAPAGRILLPTESNDCETRIAALHNEVRRYRELRRNGNTTRVTDDYFDKWAAQEDAWIAKNCDGR